jgi:hypothetical protein
MRREIKTTLYPPKMDICQMLHFNMVSISHPGAHMVIVAVSYSGGNMLVVPIFTQVRIA